MPWVPKGDITTKCAAKGGRLPTFLSNLAPSKMKREKQASKKSK